MHNSITQTQHKQPTTQFKCLLNKSYGVFFRILILKFWWQNMSHWSCRSMINPLYLPQDDDFPAFPWWDMDDRSLEGRPASSHQTSIQPPTYWAPFIRPWKSHLPGPGGVPPWHQVLRLDNLPRPRLPNVSHD